MSSNLSVLRVAAKAALTNRTASQSAQAEPASGEPVHQGVWVGLPVPTTRARTLALPDGEPAEQLHCTLAMVHPNADDLTTAQLGAIRGVVRGWARDYPAMTGEVSGPGLFTAGEKPVSVALVDVPDLSAARQDLVDRLTRIGHTPDATHGYTPHITLDYTTRDDNQPAGNLWFDQVSLGIRDDKTHFRLGTGSKIKPFVGAETEIAKAKKKEPRDGDSDGRVRDGRPDERAALHAPTVLNQPTILSGSTDASGSKQPDADGVIRLKAGESVILHGGGATRPKTADDTSGPSVNLPGRDRKSKKPATAHPEQASTPQAPKNSTTPSPVETDLSDRLARIRGHVAAGEHEQAQRLADEAFSDPAVNAAMSNDTTGRVEGLLDDIDRAGREAESAHRGVNNDTHTPGSTPDGTPGSSTPDTTAEGEAHRAYWETFVDDMQAGYYDADTVEELDALDAELEKESAPGGIFDHPAMAQELASTREAAAEARASLEGEDLSGVSDADLVARHQSAEADLESRAARFRRTNKNAIKAETRASNEDAYQAHQHASIDYDGKHEAPDFLPAGDHSQLFWHRGLVRHELLNQVPLTEWRSWLVNGKAEGYDPKIEQKENLSKFGYLKTAIPGFRDWNDVMDDRVAEEFTPEQHEIDRLQAEMSKRGLDVPASHSGNAFSTPSPDAPAESTADAPEAGSTPDATPDAAANTADITTDATGDTSTPDTAPDSTPDTARDSTPDTSTPDASGEPADEPQDLASRRRRAIAALKAKAEQATRDGQRDRLNSKIAYREWQAREWEKHKAQQRKIWENHKTKMEQERVLRQARAVYEKDLRERRKLARAGLPAGYFNGTGGAGGAGRNPGSPTTAARLRDARAREDALRAYATLPPRQPVDEVSREALDGLDQQIETRAHLLSILSSGTSADRQRNAAIVQTLTEDLFRMRRNRARLVEALPDETTPAPTPAPTPEGDPA